MIELTESEAESLRDYLEINLIGNIRDNPDVDSMLWLDNMMSIWRKCGGSIETCKKCWLDWLKKEVGHDPQD